MKTYTVVCPDCETTFTTDKTPEQLADPEDLTICPECDMVWDSEYDDEADTLELIETEEDPEADDPCETCGESRDTCDCDEEEEGQGEDDA